MDTKRFRSYTALDVPHLHSVYMACVSPQGDYLVAGSRGYDAVSIYDQKTSRGLYCGSLPFRKGTYPEGLHDCVDRRSYGLGVH